jgi:hypothetical protein
MIRPLEFHLDKKDLSSPFFSSTSLNGKEHMKGMELSKFQVLKYVQTKCELMSTYK